MWDEKTKKWVNKDGDGTEVESFRPPPMASPMQQPQMQQQQQPVPAMPQMNQFSPAPQMTQPQVETMNHMSPQVQQASPMMSVPEGLQQPPASSAPNMFKMQKGRSKIFHIFQKPKFIFQFNIFFRFEKVICRHLRQHWADSYT